VVDDWISVRDAADALGISENAVLAAIRRGELREVRVGPVVRLRARDIAEFEPRIEVRG
jgi:excisionase family DNA binding protein